MMFLWHLNYNPNDKFVYFTEMRTICYILSFVVLCQVVHGQSPLSPRIASYTIDLSLDTNNKQVNATQEVVWKNISSAPVSELQFHLYYNAFKSTESTFVQEGNIGGGLSVDGIENCGWGWVEVQSLVDSAGVELIAGAEYIHPEDDNEKDQTVLRVPLQTPVQPGESARFQMKWHSQVPKTMPRTGYNKDFYFMVQWFPKLGVYEPAGMRLATEDGWNCHQYHASGEYYSDFGNYDVSINVPSDYVVGASGKLTNKIEKGETTTWRYVIDDVIDFGWTASPKFEEMHRQWKDVDIKLLTYPEHIDCAPRYFDAVISAFEYLDENIGKYPYPTLTIVDPPIHGLFTGGMEYPTFISSVSFCFLPEGIRTPETLVVHEFVHQYFMQMVATHEVEEPWMDEGFTTYFEGKILDGYLGADQSTVNWLGVKIGNESFNRAEFFNSANPQIAPSSTKSYEYTEGGYGDIAYNKTALWLNTLEGLVGDESMSEIMKTYFETWKFKHPCGQDFINVVNAVVQKNHGTQLGQDMDWFFDQALYGTDLCDYSIARITNAKVNSAAGYLEDFEDCTTDQEGLEQYKSKVIVHRLEGMKLPVEVEVFFEDGTSELKFWDGKERGYTFSFLSNQKVVKAVLDPERKLPIDKNWLNNSYVVEPDKSGTHYYFSKFFLATQRALESLMFLI